MSELATDALALLEARLRAALHPTHLHIRDDSHQHAGHAGARFGGHYHVVIIAEAFAGKGLVARHRLVYAAAADLINQGVHALSIEARAPGEE